MLDISTKHERHLSRVFSFISNKLIDIAKFFSYLIYFNMLTHFLSASDLSDIVYLWFILEFNNNID